ncbi:MAG: NAD(P)/FAD-dependent oxidoreductase [Chitinispirillaceae bacterium]|nr:NAD(P)/FAD-dependent oxidoreductase [Chitinispirillaceae bacterium]
MEKNIIIVGAGIAGLSAGCYARMNGYRVSIFEMNSFPGGLCAAWKRKGYTWDISMHIVAGSRRGQFRRMWEELGVVGHREFYYHRELTRLEDGENEITIGLDRREVEKAMLAISPDDAAMIKKFTALLYGKPLMKMANLKPKEFLTIFDIVRKIAGMLRSIGPIIRYSKLTLQDFADTFKNPFLRNAVRFVIDSPGWPMPGFPLVGIAGFLKAGMVNAGVPLGGSQQIVSGIADRFQNLGGEIHYKRCIKKLIIDTGRVVGVRLENGGEHRADTVIWAADGHQLIFDMLEGCYVNKNIRTMYDNWIPVAPLVQVMIGVNRDMSREPHRVVIKLEKPIRIADEDHRWMSVIHHCFDPSMAPPGKSSVEVWFATDYAYWKALSGDHKKYEEEKKRIADCTIAHLDRKWPGFAGQVEVVDIPTPVTYARYTGNWRGSPDGWYVTRENMMKSGMLRSLPGLNGLYMVGHWTAPFTGTVRAALSGRQVMQIICRRDRRRFKASL